MGKPAAKQGDKITATDIHILMVPTPGGPVPTPTPLPFIGTITSGVSADVFIEGKPAATVDSVAINTPAHVPAAGPFQKPPANQGKIMIGSTGVFINGKPAARQGDMAMTCNDPADLPIGQVVAAGTVFIGETGAGAPVGPTQQPAPPKLIKAKIGQPGKIINAQWDKNRAKCGDKIMMLVDTKDFEDGTPADFIIWQKDVDTQDIFKSEIMQTVKAGKVEAFWIYSPEELKGDFQQHVEEEKGEPEYYFSVDIEGEEARSKILTLTYPMDIYMVDENGEPLDGIDFEIKFQDGASKKGQFKNGHAKLDDAPYGTFTLSIDGYNIQLEGNRG